VFVTGLHSEALGALLTFAPRFLLTNALWYS
jgi:hypothetical protein